MRRIISLVLLVTSADIVSVSAATVNCVQRNSATPQSSQTAVTVPFTSAQTAGDLNVVVVGWNDSTAVVTKLTDSSGNAYALAIGPTIQIGTLSQAVYYSKNIAAAGAGANTVMVQFNVPAVDADIRILEYNGIDQNNPVDARTAAFGNSTTSSSGPVTTTNSTDLLFGANIVRTLTSGPGSGFTSRIITSPDGDIAEDRIVTTSGSYSASAPLTSSGAWIMQMVAFRASSDVTTTPSPADSVDLRWTASSSSNVVSYNVYRAAGTGSAYAQIASGVANPMYTDNSVTGGSTYTYVVKAVDNQGDESAYSNSATVSVPSS